MMPFDVEQPDFVDEMLEAIEKDYGRSIQRIAKFNQISKYAFQISIVFSDFRLLEADLKIVEMYGLPSIEIHGIYF